MSLNWAKFVDTVHFICHKADDPSVLGAIKLNKVLWYSDVLQYMLSGSSITGEQYVKRQFGPVPRHALAAVDKLVEDGRIARGKVDHFGFKKNEYVSIREPDLSKFTAEEIALIDEAFEHVCLNHTAKSISEETHGVIWELASTGEPMPYSTVFASTEDEVTEDDLDWALATLAKHHPAPVSR